MTTNRVTISAVILAILVLSMAGSYATFCAAHRQLSTIGLYHPRIKGIRIPCAEGLDAGVVVVYQEGKRMPEHTGRLCFNGHWVWYPSTNNLEVSHAL